MVALHKNNVTMDNIIKYPGFSNYFKSLDIIADVIPCVHTSTKGSSVLTKLKFDFFPDELIINKNWL